MWDNSDRSNTPVYLFVERIKNIVEINTYTTYVADVPLFTMDVLQIILFLCLTLGTVSSSRDLTKEPGHLKPFGTGRPSQQIDEVEGFPEQKAFMRDYVIGSRPMKMKGAAKLSPAFDLWTDDYFLSLDLPEDSVVHLETRKKEDRMQDTEDMKFRDFVKIYNTTEHYMVDNVPEYLWLMKIVVGRSIGNGSTKDPFPMLCSHYNHHKPVIFVIILHRNFQTFYHGNDIVFPCAVQCTQLMEECVVAALMWFSSGGTNSVLHADAVDNINCLFRGEKTFVMVDTNKYRDKVDLDHPEGLYSSVDVDKVDYTKFPGLADVEYYHVNMSAGDCLYIPYRWFHQVRSYGSNLAVNLWWDHYTGRDINLDSCSSKCDTNTRLGAVKQHGMDSIAFSIGTIKDQLINTVAVRSLQLEGFKKVFSGGGAFDAIEDESEKKRFMQIYNELAEEFFNIMDADNDGSISKEDLATLPEEAWWDAQTYVSEIENLFRGEDDDEDEEEDETSHDEL